MGVEILLADSVSWTVVKWRGGSCLCPLLPSVISRMHTSTWSLYSWMLQAATSSTSTQTCLAMHQQNGRLSPLI